MDIEAQVTLRQRHRCNRGISTHQPGRAGTPRLATNSDRRQTNSPPSVSQSVDL